MRVQAKVRRQDTNTCEHTVTSPGVPQIEWELFAQTNPALFKITSQVSSYFYACVVRRQHAARGLAALFYVVNCVRQAGEVSLVYR
jgi:hypothetical protein